MQEGQEPRAHALGLAREVHPLGPELALEPDVEVAHDDGGLLDEVERALAEKGQGARHGLRQALPAA
jgi:hypothetical protein